MKILTNEGRFSLELLYIISDRQKSSTEKRGLYLKTLAADL
jgi:hypothetical protein